MVLVLDGAATVNGGLWVAPYMKARTREEVVASAL
jgi:hypothetical protein